VGPSSSTTYHHSVHRSTIAIQGRTFSQKIGSSLSKYLKFRKKRWKNLQKIGKLLGLHEDVPCYAGLSEKSSTCMENGTELACICSGIDKHVCTILRCPLDHTYMPTVRLYHPVIATIQFFLGTQNS
jgi:hypothetical protein